VVAIELKIPVAVALRQKLFRIGDIAGIHMMAEAESVFPIQDVSEAHLPQVVPANPKAEVELSEPPRDSFLTLTSLALNESAYLDVANRFGFLGVPRVHFHSGETPIQWGEPLSFWRHEVGLLHRWLEVWKLYTDGNARLLRRKLKELLPAPLRPTSSRLRSSNWCT